MSSILLHLAISFATLGVMEIVECIGMPIRINRIYAFIPGFNIFISLLLITMFALASSKKMILIRIADKYFICFNHKTNKALGFFTDRMICMHIGNMDSFREYLRKNLNNKAEVLATMLTCRDMLKDRKCLGNVNILWNNENNIFVLGVSNDDGNNN